MAHQAGIETAITPEQFKALQRFLTLRIKWNSTHNLMGPETTHGGWRKDIIDTLALAKTSKQTMPLVDVGAGGGVPGLMMGCLQPKRRIFLIEPRAKRAAFLRSATWQLGLKAVKVVRARWPEGIQHIRDTGPWEVVSRAVVAPEKWPKLAAQGGTEVGAILRLLAQKHPPWSEDGFEMTDRLAYVTSDRGQRCIERWCRMTTHRKA